LGNRKRSSSVFRRNDGDWLAVPKGPRGNKIASVNLREGGKRGALACCSFFGQIRETERRTGVGKLVGGKASVLLGNGSLPQKYSEGGKKDQTRRIVFACCGKISGWKEVKRTRQRKSLEEKRRMVKSEKHGGKGQDGRGERRDGRRQLKMAQGKRE